MISSLAVDSTAYLRSAFALVANDPKHYGLADHENDRTIFLSTVTMVKTHNPHDNFCYTDFSPESTIKEKEKRAFS